MYHGDACSSARRSFHTESLEERQEWVDAYTKVQQSISVTAAAAAAQQIAESGDGADGSGGPKKEWSLKDFDMQTVLGKGQWCRSPHRRSGTHAQYKHCCPYECTTSIIATTATNIRKLDCSVRWSQ